MAASSGSGWAILIFRVRHIRPYPPFIRVYSPVHARIRIHFLHVADMIEYCSLYPQRISSTRIHSHVFAPCTEYIRGTRSGHVFLRVYTLFEANTSNMRAGPASENKSDDGSRCVSVSELRKTVCKDTVHADSYDTETRWRIRFCETCTC